MSTRTGWVSMFTRTCCPQTSESASTALPHLWTPSISRRRRRRRQAAAGFDGRTAWLPPVPPPPPGAAAAAAVPAALFPRLERLREAPDVYEVAGYGRRDRVLRPP